MPTSILEFIEGFEGEFHADDLHKFMYATDASVYRKLPLAVAYPKNIRDLKLLVDFAHRNGTSIIPRAAGTSLAGQCVGEGIVVDVSRYFTRILDLDLEKKQVTVQPGVIRDDLNRFLEPHGLFFGPNTSTSNRCMIGGMVGNNSSGTTSIQYGVTRDKVVRLTTVLANGDEAVFEKTTKAEFLEKANRGSFEAGIYRTIYELLSSKEVQEEIRKQYPKPEIHRRNTGYALDRLIESSLFDNSEEDINLCHLLSGSEGTLAITTEITLQLDALPPGKTVLIAAHYWSINTCMEDVLNVMQHDLYACELMDRIILERTRENLKYAPYRSFVKDDPAAMLLLELRANSTEDLKSQEERLLKTLIASGLSYSQPVLRGEEVNKAMELRKAGLGLLGNMIGDKKAVACIEDTAVALPDLPGFIKAFGEIMERYEQDAVYYAHAGAGEIHLRPILNLKDEHDVAHFRNITTEVAHLTKKYNGSFSGEHGDGIVRSEFIPILIGNKNYRLLEKIKTTFDPRQILNPGKIVYPEPMDKGLRYQPGVLDPDVKTVFDFSDSEGILKLAEKCNGSGDCRKSPEAGGVMCPSYHATKNEKDTTRARANALREVLRQSEKANKFDSEELKEVFDLCIGCKACSSECPSNVDIATIKSEFLYHYYRSNKITKADRLIAKSSKYFKWARRFPKIAGFAARNGTIAGLIKKYGGIAAKRSLPKFPGSKLKLKREYPAARGREQGVNVLLFVDEFSKTIDTGVVLDAIELLTGLGYTISIVDQLNSARSLISKGFLDEATAEIDKNIDYLSDRVSRERPLIGLEPSAILGFRDEFPRLASRKEDAERISRHCYLIEEFLTGQFEEGRFNSAQFSTEQREIKIHIHCHQKSLSNQKHTFDLLNIPKNYSPVLITAGCCGMAGGFGFEKNHFELSMKIGELKLFPAIRKAKDSTIIAANGTSCRHQILDGTSILALHPVSILKDALL